MRHAGPSRQESPSDWELIQLARDGEADAFPALLDRYMPIIRSEVKRFAGAGGADPEDLIQEAMITLFRAVHGYNPEGGARFGTYAVTSIRHSLSASIRKHRKGYPQGTELDPELADKAAASPEAAERPVEDAYLDREATRWRAYQIETLLSDFERRVLKLYLSGYTYQQISTVLESSTKAVDNALQRVRRKLRPDV